MLGAVLLSPVLPAAHAAPGCGHLDMPETGVAGEVPLPDQISGRAELGYNCGVAVVGYNDLGGRGGNANMAWSQDCAYIAGDGVAVVDVHDPTRPRLVRTLHGAGSDKTTETLHAVDTSTRHLLVAGKYGIGGYSGEPGKGPVDIYDTSDCTHPKLLSHFDFPANVHNLTLSADGTRLFSTLPLQAADLTNPRRPTYLGDLDVALRAAGVQNISSAHEAWPSPNGKRLYVGNQVPRDRMVVLDIADWPRRPLKVVGRALLPGHSVRPANVNGKPYLLMSEESIGGPTANGCLPKALNPFAGAAQPFLVDISNDRTPHAVSQFRLAINEPQNCLREAAAGMDASVHYNDVDDPNHTTFALLSMWNAGLRIVDWRDPLHPTEVAYFNPGSFGGALDQAWAHIRYQPATGLIWFTTQTGGLWVLELEPQVRALLDLPSKPAHHPRGRAPDRSRRP